MKAADTVKESMKYRPKTYIGGLVVAVLGFAELTDVKPIDWLNSKTFGRVDQVIETQAGQYRELKEALITDRERLIGIEVTLANVANNLEDLNIYTREDLIRVRARLDAHVDTHE